MCACPCSLWTVTWVGLGHGSHMLVVLCLLVPSCSKHFCLIHDVDLRTNMSGGTSRASVRLLLFYVVLFVFVTNDLRGPSSLWLG